MGTPIEISPGYGQGGERVFEDVLSGADDVIGDVLVPVDVAHVEAVDGAVGGRQLFRQPNRIVVHKTPRVQQVEAQRVDGFVRLVVKPHLHDRK